MDGAVGQAGGEHHAAEEGGMKHALTDIQGIGPGTAALLAEHGIDSVKALLKAGEKGLSKVPGFAEIRAGNVLAAAKALTDDDKGEKKAAKKAKKAAKVESKPSKKAVKKDKGKKAKKGKKGKKSKK